MRRSSYKMLLGLAAAAILLAACGSATQAPPPTEASDGGGGAASGKVCEVTDTGGVDDKSFNQSSWDGAQNGANAVGWEASVLESQQQTDYEKNINEFLQQRYDESTPFKPTLEQLGSILSERKDEHVQPKNRRQGDR